MTRGPKPGARVRKQPQGLVVFVVFLKRADVVQVEIAEIGALENPLYPSG